MRQPGTSLALALGFGLVLVAGEARAQRSPGAGSPIVRLLQTSDDARERTSAALTLRAVHTPEARAALEQGLGDASPAVRAAAASSLQAHGDAAAVPSLEAHAADPDADVREAIASALGALRTSADLTHARVVVGEGPFHARGSSDPRHTETVRVAVDRSLRAHHGIAVHAGPLPSAAVARVRRGQLRAYSLQGGVTQLTRAHQPDGFTVRAEVSLVLVSEPTHAILGMVTGAATVRQPSAGARPDALTRLEGLAIESAVQGALRDFERQLEDAR